VRRQSKLSNAEKAYDRALELRPDLMIASLNLEDYTFSTRRSPTRLRSWKKPWLIEAIRLAPVEKAAIHLRLAAPYHSAGYKDRASSRVQTLFDEEAGLQ